jgi:hypothetical protein
MSVMESALAELRALAVFKPIDVTVEGDSTGSDSSGEIAEA